MRENLTIMPILIAAFLYSGIVFGIGFLIMILVPEKESPHVA